MSAQTWDRCCHLVSDGALLDSIASQNVAPYASWYSVISKQPHPQTVDPFEKAHEGQNNVAYLLGASVTKAKGFMTLRTGNSFCSGGLSTIDFHVLTSLDQLLFILKILITYFYKTNNLNEEVNCTKPSVLRILN